MSKPTSTRLGQILLDKGLVTVEQLDIAIKEQQKRRQLLDPFDENLGVKSSLGEILIELGFIDRLQLRRGLNWQLMLRKMAIVMSFCAPLMTVSYGAAAAPRPTFTAYASSSSLAPKVNPTFTRTSSSASSALAVNNELEDASSSSADMNPEIVPESASVVSSSSRVSSIKSFASRSSKASSVVSSISKSSVISSKSATDPIAPQMPEKITVVSALSDRVNLSWVPASDNVGVIGYKIFRDQVQIDTINAAENSYMDFNVTADKTYLYGISAGDAAGNWSVIKSVFAQTEAVAPVTYTQASSSVSSIPQLVASSSSKDPTVTPTPTSSASSAPISSVASSKSSAPSSVVSSGSSSSNVSSSTSSKVSSSTSSTVSSVSINSPQTSTVAGPVNFNWAAPALRENGSLLDITELGGYELRYRKTIDTVYTYVTINDAWKNYYNFTWLEGTYIFQVAAFDKNGLYSTFVDLTPH